MPTGYTARIADGVTFKEYALGCARAFGALVTMRDEPRDAPIPEKFGVSTYHADEIDKARAGLTELSSLSLAEAQIRADAAKLKDLEYHERAIANNKVLRGKYEAMLAQAEAYVSPSSEHDEYRQFMISQIQESIEFDCGGDYHQRQIAQLESVTGREWIDSERESLESGLEYHRRELKKEEERAAERSVWVKQLMESLAKFE